MSHVALENDLPARAHHLPATGLVVLATALLTLVPERFGDTGRLFAVLLLQLALVAAWVLATGIRGFVGSLGIGGAAAVSADLLMVLPDRPDVDGLLVVLGIGFLVMVVHQMLRPPPRRYLVASLSGVVLLVCSVCALSLLLSLGRRADGDRAVTTTALAVGAALVVGHLVDLVLPRPGLAEGVPRGLLGLVLAVSAAVGVLVLRLRPTDMEGLLAAATPGAVLGAVAALIAVGASYVVAERPQQGWALPMVQAVLPFAAVAPIAVSVALQTAL